MVVLIVQNYTRIARYSKEKAVAVALVEKIRQFIVAENNAAPSRQSRDTPRDTDMKRREFLTGQVAASEEPMRLSKMRSTVSVAATLDEHTTPLTESDVLHLLRRATFGPTTSMVASLVGKTASEAVEMLLGADDTQQPAAPGDWTETQTENPEDQIAQIRGQIHSQYRNWFEELQRWWAEAMRVESFPNREKLTFFWSGHFTTQFSFDNILCPPQLLYRQNLMQRRNRLGSLREFLMDVTLDSAMLYYLGGDLNVKGSPNENYARELYELYSTGIDLSVVVNGDIEHKAWYSEGDVQETARVLTGWKAQKFNDQPALNGPYETYFWPNDHDIEGKTLFGESIPARTANANTEFQVREEEIGRVIDMLLRQDWTFGDGVTRNAAATFICTKLFRYYIYSSPTDYDRQFIDELAQLFEQSDFNIRTVVKALLSSAFFFDPANRGVQIKMPTELIVGLVRGLQTTAPTAAAMMNSLEQELFNPPDVSGWDGYRTWISTKTYPLRLVHARAIIESATAAQLSSFVQQFENVGDPNVLVPQLVEFFLPVAVTQERLNTYLETFLDGSPDYEWENILNNDMNKAANMIRLLLISLSKAPDFQLC